MTLNELWAASFNDDEEHSGLPPGFHWWTMECTSIPDEEAELAVRPVDARGDPAEELEGRLQRQVEEAQTAGDWRTVEDLLTHWEHLYTNPDKEEGEPTVLRDSWESFLTGNTVTGSMEGEEPALFERGAISLHKNVYNWETGHILVDTVYHPDQSDRWALEESMYFQAEDQRLRQLRPTEEWGSTNLSRIKTQVESTKTTLRLLALALKRSKTSRKGMIEAVLQAREKALKEAASKPLLHQGYPLYRWSSGSKSEVFLKDEDSWRHVVEQKWVRTQPPEGGRLTPLYRKSSSRIGSWTQYVYKHALRVGEEDIPQDLKAGGYIRAPAVVRGFVHWFTGKYLTRDPSLVMALATDHPQYFLSPVRPSWKATVEEETREAVRLLEPLYQEVVASLIY